MEAVDVCNKLDCFREGGITKEWPLQPTLTRLWPAFSTSLFPVSSASLRLQRGLPRVGVRGNQWRWSRSRCPHGDPRIAHAWGDASMVCSPCWGLFVGQNLAEQSVLVSITLVVLLWTLPVMLWIHGLALTTSCAKQFHWLTACFVRSCWGYPRAQCSAGGV